MNCKQLLLKALITIGFLAGTSTAWSFQKKISLQGFIKNSTGPLTESGTLNYRILVKKGSTFVWGKDYTSQSITDGVLNQVLSGGGDDLLSAGYSNFSAVDIGDVFDGSGATDAYSAIVYVDLDHNGLTGSDSNFAVNLTGVPMALTANSLSTTAAVPAAQITGTVTNSQLAADAADTTQIKDGAVTTVKIASGAVTTAKIASGAIDSTLLASGAVTSSAIASGAVGSSALATGAVGSGALATGAVASAALGAGAVDATAIGTDAVITAKIQDGAVTSSKLAAGAVDATALGTDAVVTAKIQNAAVTGNKLATGAVDVSTSVVTGALPVANGGTGAASASAARTALSAAASGANTDITSLTFGGSTGALSTYAEAQTCNMSLIGITAAGSGTYTYNVCRYTQIGKMVFLNWAFTTTANTGTGNMRISGLPLASLNVTNFSQACQINHSATTFTPGVGLKAVIAPNSTTADVYNIPATNTAHVQIAMDATVTWYVTCNYLVD